MGSNCCRRQAENDSSVSSLLDDIILNPQPPKDQPQELRQSLLKFKPETTEQDDKVPVQEKIEMPDGSSYEGFTVNGIPNGKGIQKHENGDLYEGEFVDGLKQGIGKYTYKDGGRYIGEFKGGKIEGQGNITLPNGDTYEGTFENNIINGYGKYYSKSKKATYQGEFRNGKRNGKGRLHGQGIEISGVWKEGKFQYDNFAVK